MSSLDGAVRIEERGAHGERCAYCHGALDGELARCELCHVELHADCRATLGRCPTLGCSPRPGAREDAFAPPAEATPALSRDGAWPRWLALAELYLTAAGGAALFGLCSLGLGAGVAGVLAAAVAAVVDAVRHQGGVHAEVLAGVAGMLGIALFLAWLARQAGLTSRDFLRGARRARALLATAPSERVLVATDESAGRYRARSYALEPRTRRDPVQGFLALRPTFMIGAGWSWPGASDVRVYGLGDEGPLVLESTRGRLLVAFREDPPARFRRPRGSRRP